MRAPLFLYFRSELAPIWLFTAIFLYFSAHIVIRATGSSVLELDEAEQIVLTQWWAWGYSGQPPLYTWLQTVFFQWFGVNLWSLALLKNLLLGLIYLFFYLIAKEILKDKAFASLATLSLFWLPQVVWESQRDLTHSVLVTLIALASIYSVLRLLDKACWRHYLLFGILIALGMLSKYNYALLLATIMLALVSLPKGRAVLWQPMMLITLLVSIVLVLPHALWFWQNATTGSSALNKLWHNQGIWPFAGIWDLIRAIIAFLLPFGLICWLCWRKYFSFKMLDMEKLSDAQRFLVHYLQALLLVCLLLILVLGVMQFRERWLLPVLTILPLLFFIALDKQVIRALSTRIFIGLTIGIAISALLAISIRVQEWPLAPYLQRHHFPFDELSMAIVERVDPDTRVIIGERAFWAGNLRFRFPYTPATFTGVASDLMIYTHTQGMILIWDASTQQVPPPRLLDYAKTLSQRIGANTFMVQSVVLEIEQLRSLHQVGLLELGFYKSDKPYLPEK